MESKLGVRFASLKFIAPLNVELDPQSLFFRKMLMKVRSLSRKTFCVSVIKKFGGEVAEIFTLFFFFLALIVHYNSYKIRHFNM